MYAKNTLFAPLIVCTMLGTASAVAATDQQKQAAVNKGLAYLHSTQQTNGSWSYNGYDQAATGAVVLTFASLKEQWSGVSYGDAVKKAVAYLLNAATKMTVSTRNDGVNICPSGSGECLGIYWGSGSGEESYTTGLVTPALMTYANRLPNVVATTEGPLAGLTWGQIAQGIVNIWSASQSTANQGDMIGGWRYLLAGGQYDSDMSTTQWGIISLTYATQAFPTPKGVPSVVVVPDIVMTDLKKWLAFAQDPDSGVGCYQGVGSSPCDHADTGGLLLGLKFVGYNDQNPQVQKALGYLNTHWKEMADGTWFGNFGHPYAMWSIYKGLEVTLPGNRKPNGLDNNTTITNLLSTCGAPDNLPGKPPGAEPCNWWADYNEWLIANQNPDGSWNGYSYWVGPLATAFHVSILGPTVVPQLTLTVTKSGDGTVKSNPAGIDCGTDCSEGFLLPTDVLLTAVPSPQFTFKGWGGACSGTGDCSLKVDADKAVKADFAPITLTVTKAGTGTGTVKSESAGIDCGDDCSERYDSGTVVKLTATAVPAKDSTFAGWGGSCAGVGGCQVTMTEAKTVTATFNLKAQPNFVVTAMTLTPASPTANSTFSAAVTVKNQGTGAADAGTLAVWSNQSTAPACNAKGNKSIAVGKLAAGMSKTLTVAGLASGIAGSKTLLAFVDSACSTAESNENDNQLTKPYTVTTGPGGQPDFIVTSLTITPSSPATGETFGATITVKNQGKVSADAGYLDVWDNESTVQPCGSAGVEWAEIGTLNAGATKTLGITLRTARAGSKTLRAFVDSGCETTESNEENNQFTKVYTVK